MKARLCLRTSGGPETLFSSVPGITWGVLLASLAIVSCGLVTEGSLGNYLCGCPHAQALVSGIDGDWSVLHHENLEPSGWGQTNW